MEKKTADMTYTEVVVHLMEQLATLTKNFVTLDEREVHLQKMMERIQTHLDYKADKTEIIKLQAICDALSAVDKAVKEQKKSEEKLKEKGRTEWKWFAVVLFNAALFIIGFLKDIWLK